MPDHLLTARGAGGAISLVAARTTDLVADARTRHDLAPTASAAVGRLLTAVALFGGSLAGRERVSIQVRGNGPIGGIDADAWLLGENRIGARAFAARPRTDVPLNGRGKFDVAGAVGTSGTLQVTLSHEVGQPYNGVVPLVSGEIGDDIAAYLSQSQQIPSVVALGVLADPEGIRAAGGAIAQLLPGADESTIAALERNAATMPAVTQAIDGGADAEALMRNLLGDLDLKITGRYEVVFDCRCTREKVETALLGLGRDALERMSREEPETEAICDFCRQRYVLSRDEVAGLAARL